MNVGGMLGGNPAVSSFHDWNIAYMKYCDGGCFSGNRTDPDHLNGTDIWYRGFNNMHAILDDLSDKHDLANAKEVIVSGCSAGGQSCYIHCDTISKLLSPVPVRCVCDAGVFPNYENVVAKSNFMNTRFYDVVDNMHALSGLNPRCTSTEKDPRDCFFSNVAVQYTETPLFSLNSDYNFMVFVELSSTPWNYTVPESWQACTPYIGKITPDTYKICNSTQKEVIQGYRNRFVKDMGAAVLPPKSSHGSFWVSCPTHHCQTGSDALWTNTKIKDSRGTELSINDAVATWYFNHSSVKLVDSPFPSNPTC